MRAAPAISSPRSTSQRQQIRPSVHQPPLQRVCVCRVLPCPACVTPAAPFAARTTRRHIYKARPAKRRLFGRAGHLIVHSSYTPTLGFSNPCGGPPQIYKYVQIRLRRTASCTVSWGLVRFEVPITQPRRLFSLPPAVSRSALLQKPACHSLQPFGLLDSAAHLFGHLSPVLRWASSLLVRLACIGSSIPHSSHDSWPVTHPPPPHSTRAAAAAGFLAFRLFPTLWSRALRSLSLPRPSSGPLRELHPGSDAARAAASCLCLCCCCLCCAACRIHPRNSVSLLI